MFKVVSIKHKDQYLYRPACAIANKTQYDLIALPGENINLHILNFNPLTSAVRPKQRGFSTEMNPCGHIFLNHQTTILACAVKGVFLRWMLQQLVSSI